LYKNVVQKWLSVRESGAEVAVCTCTHVTERTNSIENTFYMYSCLHVEESMRNLVTLSLSLSLSTCVCVCVCV
jgi:hypothetical protein